MRGIKLIALVMTASACLSCGNMSKHEQSRRAIGEALKTPKVWQDIETETAATPENWLEGFNDPILFALIEEAKSKNIDLKISAKNIEKAWLLAAGAGVDLKPKVDIAVGKTQYGVSIDSYNKSFGYIDTGMSMQLELDVWGRIREGAEAAKMNAQVAEADYAFAQQSLSATIAKTYLKIIEAKQQMVISHKNRANLEETLRITRVKYENGLSSVQDVALNSANLAAVDDQLLSLKGAERDSVRALELLLGRYPGASIAVASVLPTLPAPPVAGLPSELLERRPDIIAAERSVVAAFHRSAEAKAAFLPRVVLSDRIASGSEHLSGLFDPGLYVWKLAGTLLIPIFDGGRRKINSQLATVEQEQATLNYTRVALDAFFEVENNLYHGKVLADREVMLGEVSHQSAIAHQISEIRYIEGEVELLDMLAIQREAISAESTLLGVKRARLDQQIDLYLSLGGNW
ncbi:MAG: TolC family protein [Gammaproteobacteria bacterium]|nr:TolC family protein [Gammaproteobacteria bacterium]MBQ0839198.1 TolC family protein [Gammaproteobacteria bacterium]